MMKGIDVSTFQGSINWENVKAGGVEFAIIRGGYGNDASQKDDKLIKNLDGALTAGIKCGIYWFSYAVSAADAKLEADVCHSIIKFYKDRLSLPVFFDWEYDSDKYARKLGVVPDKSLITDMTIAFMDRLSGYGYDVGFYTNVDYSENKYDMSRLTNYKLWMAYYKDKKYDGAYMQQTASDGSVDGIVGNVDIDICYGNLSVSAPVIELPAYTVGKEYTLQTDIKVRTGAGVDKQQKSRSLLTKDGQAHAMPYDMAVLKTGTVVTCLETQTVGGDEVWLRIPSGWVCGCYKGEIYIN